MSENFTLALETGISGGSLCLFKDQKEKFSWTGNGKNTNSRDLLRILDKLVNNYNVEKSKLKKIIISEGPGSFTGLRIGGSIAKALKIAYDCEIVRASVLDALRIKRLITTPVYQSKDNELIWKLNRENNIGGLEISEYNGGYIEFLKFISQKSVQGIIASENLYKKLSDEGSLGGSIQLFTFPANLAILMGRYYFSTHAKKWRGELK